MITNAKEMVNKYDAKASCWDCNEFYIGKTKRRLRDRKKDHFKALKGITQSSCSKNRSQHKMEPFSSFSKW